VSPEQVIVAGGTLTLAHGLGVTPKIVTAELVCKSSTIGYSVGDVVFYGLTPQSDQTKGISTASDSTNLFCSYGSAGNSIEVAIKGSNIVTPIITDKWKVVWRAFA
jgi:hypothetical protein